MHPNQPSKRRRREYQVSAESLETRELLTGGAGNTFAIMPASVTTAGQTAVVKFTIDPSHFTTPRHQLTLGVDIVADPSSSVVPQIVSVKPDAGGAVMQTIHARYDSHISQVKVTAGSTTSAVIVPLHITPGKPQTFDVTVKGMNNTSGKFLLGFYLPGDTNGDGVVDQTDIKAVKTAMGAAAGGTRYAFDGDANRNGKITSTDLTYAMQNLGVKTTITPVVSAVPDQTFDPQLATTGNTTKSQVKYTGTLSPGATITFNDNSSATPAATATADSQGNYSVTMPLVPGSNTFHLATLDAFGQSISGTIAPVTYNTTTPVTAASLASLVSQLNAGSGTPTAAATTAAAATTTKTA
jgi:hypothetical protein